ncbi:uncharacterized protein LOC106866680 [Brachypodium distachyon]|uniref:uncharacterized protein LOC106866680 n=1 Tax=Brachypodium distachyon TaxID=15368 RepID=UPI000D0CF190|nr:uncharacterized protein LOC106866680 [Brachypodium distachyon]|eukprot:XP_024310308.1 uncharacterized protein LOC106866680 [Brachypodium distachyon]
MTRRASLRRPRKSSLWTTTARGPAAVASAAAVGAAASSTPGAAPDTTAASSSVPAAPRAAPTPQAPTALPARGVFWGFALRRNPPSADSPVSASKRGRDDSPPAAPKKKARVDAGSAADPGVTGARSVATAPAGGPTPTEVVPATVKATESAVEAAARHEIQLGSAKDKSAKLENELATVREELDKAGNDIAVKTTELAALESNLRKAKKAAHDARLHHGTLIGQRKLETEKLLKIAEALRDLLPRFELQAAAVDGTDVSTFIPFFSNLVGKLGALDIWITQFKHLAFRSVLRSKRSPEVYSRFAALANT